MINLSAKPFCLNERGIAWVNGMLSSLSIEEKVGQIFNLVFSGNDDSALASMMKRIPCGGITFRANMRAADPALLQTELIMLLRLKSQLQMSLDMHIY